jgi:hypothetical protein
MSPQTVVIIAAASVVLGTVGGLIEGKAKPGSFWYGLGRVLASLGTDLASLGKMGGGAS